MKQKKMNEFIYKILLVDNKIKGHNLLWNVIYQIRFDKNWAKVILDVNELPLS